MYSFYSPGMEVYCFPKFVLQLQTTFEHNNFPEPGDQQCIARQLKAPYRSIKMWFQNKRANARKKLFPGEKGKKMN